MKKLACKRPCKALQGNMVVTRLETGHVFSQCTFILGVGACDGFHDHGLVPPGQLTNRGRRWWVREG